MDLPAGLHFGNQWQEQLFSLAHFINIDPPDFCFLFNWTALISLQDELKNSNSQARELTDPQTAPNPLPSPSDALPWLF